MRLISFLRSDLEETGLFLDDKVYPIKTLNRYFKWDFPSQLDSIFKLNLFYKMKNYIDEKISSIPQNDEIDFISLNDIQVTPLYRHPSKIWGIGLNYKDHASDLNETTPTSIPASFMKADTTIIGQGDEIVLPSIAEKTTGEAELGVIIGKQCKNVPRDKWLDVIAGFTCIIDMTAESILRKNPRYLTVSKNFDTFFSFGPVLITPDEIGDFDRLKVATIHNGYVHADNIIQNMTFPPDDLVSFHSKIMTFKPGDIISTGTPRAVTLKNGDVISCRIGKFPLLSNPVISE